MKLSRALDDQLSEIEFDDRNWFTSEHLLARGIGVCFHCGNLMSIDDTECDECHETLFIRKMDDVSQHIENLYAQTTIHKMLHPQNKTDKHAA